MQAYGTIARQLDAPAAHQSGWRPGVVGLALVVVGWWALLVGALALTFPPVQPAASGGFTPVPGSRAHIRALGPPGWPIPAERDAYDEYNQGFLAEDDAAVEHALTAYVWIDVLDHEAVRILEVDADIVQVELLEGQNAGRRGWLWAPHVGP